MALFRKRVLGGILTAKDAEFERDLNAKTAKGREGPKGFSDFKEQSGLYAARPSLLQSAGKFIAFERGELSRRLKREWWNLAFGQGGSRSIAVQFCLRDGVNCYL